MKILKRIADFFCVIAGIIISVFAALKINELFNKKENWKPIKDKPDYVKLNDNGKWKEIKLPKKENGKQIKNNEIQTINISKEGTINVTIKEGITDRRNIPHISDVFNSDMDL